MAQMSVITGLERRRFWSNEQKLELLTEAFGPGGSVADVARRADICSSLLYRWRQASRSKAAPTSFMPAVVSDDHGARTPPAPAAAIHIVFPGRASVSIASSASPALIAAALGALR